MFLKSLTLKGFKSFADPSTLQLEPGVTVVVGPNGSGKSNVVDAVAWVLGAQGPRTVRSSKMEDVIFAGSADRPALGRAEVSLTIDNRAGHLPGGLAEITITRTLFRSGDSEYALNGQPCRLLDIQELLSDSGVGRTQHVIVSQGQLDQILNARPEDRRAVIEEAAGILKHRRRRERAERRLAATEENLERLGDLLREVRRQMRPLERQAAAARSHASLAEELKDLRLFLIGRELAALDERRRKATTERDRLGQAEVAPCGPRSTSSTRRPTRPPPNCRRAARTASSPPSPASTVWANAAGASAGSWPNGAVRSSRPSTPPPTPTSSRPSRPTPPGCPTELDDDGPTDGRTRARLLGRWPRPKPNWPPTWPPSKPPPAISATMRAAEEAFAVARGEREPLRRALERDRGDLDQLAERVAVLERRRPGPRSRAGRSGRSAGRGRGRGRRPRPPGPTRPGARRPRPTRSATRPRADGGRPSRPGIAWKPGPRPWPGPPTRPGVSPGPMSWPVSPGSWGHWSSWSRSTTAGRAPSKRPWARPWPAWSSRTTTPPGPPWPRLHQSDVVGTVLTLRNGRTRPPPVADPAGLRPDAELVRRHVRSSVPGRGGSARPPPGRRRGRGRRAGARPSTTPSSAPIWWWSPQPGTASRPPAGSSTPAPTRPPPWPPSRPAGKRRRRPAAAERADAEATEARAGADAARAAADGGQPRRRTGRRSPTGPGRGPRPGSGSEIESLWSRKVTEAVRHNTALADRIERDTVRLAELDDASARAGAGGRRRRHPVCARPTRPAVSTRSAGPRSRADVAIWRSGWAGWPNGGPCSRTASRTWSAAWPVMWPNATRPVSAVVAWRPTPGPWTAWAPWSTGHAARLAGLSERLQEERSRQLDEVRAGGARLEDLRRQRSAVESRITETRDTLQRLALELAESGVRQESAVEALRRELGCEPEVAMAAACPPLPEGVKAADRAAAIETELASLGPVNPLALEELGTLEERHRFLEEQVEDVRRARRELHQVIRAVDDEIMRIFAEAFADVNEHFQVLVATLFPGGTGRLVLTDPTDLLDTGVEVEARPAGKNVRKLSLLSGGERSLVALAFLFAVFRSRPSPFYLMDEVEAALDDVNLHRFLDLLHEFREEAQLIIVSHQKRTMEAADALYGVTMTPGGSSKVVSQKVRRQTDDESAAASTN